MTDVKKPKSEKPYDNNEKLQMNRKLKLFYSNTFIIAFIIVHEPKNLVHE